MTLWCRRCCSYTPSVSMEHRPRADWTQVAAITMGLLAYPFVSAQIKSVIIRYTQKVILAVGLEFEWNN